MMIRKQSKQRDLVLQYMKQIREHVSAEQVYDDLNKDTKSISLATVYRNLNILVQMHEIRKSAHPIYGYVYDKTCDPHDHLHCVICDQLFDFPIAYDMALDDTMEKQSGWQVYSHNTIYEGVCEHCMKKEKRQNT